MKNQIAVIGECMIEVKPHAAIGYGGDTLNFSVYLARLGVGVCYVTAIGDDPMSDWMIKEWQKEGVECRLVKQEANAVPGLYLIDVDSAGERSFFYWRDQSPARAIFESEDSANELFKELYEFEYLYLSGITLAIYTDAARQRLFRFFDDYRKRGGQVLFDNNFRPRQWRDEEQARAVFEQMYRRADVALPTMDDELLLYGQADEKEVISRLQDWGVKEIILKKGAEGCSITRSSKTEQVSATFVKNVVDTTAAGDSFNAGFVAAKFAGRNNRQAAAFGNSLASTVVQHRGAIIQKEAMKGLVM